MIRIINTFQKANLKVQALISSISMGLYFWTSYILENSYLKSKFPVPYFIQQTSFDAVKMKEWYAIMIQENTLSTYFKTQLVDFVFILAVIIAGFTLWTFISNLHPKNSWFRKSGYIFSISLPLAGLFDIFENIISFFMLAKPTEFANGLIIPYSTFASIKFGFWAIGLIWLLVSLLGLLISKFRNKQTLVHQQ